MISYNLRFGEIYVYIVPNIKYWITVGNSLSYKNHGGYQLYLAIGRTEHGRLCVF